MFGLWVSRQDWERILHGIPNQHSEGLRAYLGHTHYRIVGLLHVVKRYKIGRTEGLDGTLSERQSLAVGKRFIGICRARKKARRRFAIGLVALSITATGIITLMGPWPAG